MAIHLSLKENDLVTGAMLALIRANTKPEMLVHCAQYGHINIDSHVLTNVMPVATFVIE